MASGRIIDDDSEYAWPPAFSGMRALDSLFRCACCAGVYSGAVLLEGCGHSFCSVCVRTWLTTGNQSSCPRCRKPATLGSVKSNPDFEALCSAFARVRADVLASARACAPSALRVSSPSGSGGGGGGGGGSAVGGGGGSSSAYGRTFSLLDEGEGGGSATAAGASPGAAQRAKVDALPPLQRQPLYAYSALSLKNVKDLCTKAGLPNYSATGKDGLTLRHRTFVNLWNGAVDTLASRRAAAAAGSTQYSLAELREVNKLQIVAATEAAERERERDKVKAAALVKEVPPMMQFPWGAGGGGGGGDGSGSAPSSAAAAGHAGPGGAMARVGAEGAALDAKLRADLQKKAQAAKVAKEAAAAAAKEKEGRGEREGGEGEDGADGDGEGEGGDAGAPTALSQASAGTKRSRPPGSSSQLAGRRPAGSKGGGSGAKLAAAALSPSRAAPPPPPPLPPYVESRYSAVCHRFYFYLKALRADGSAVGSFVLRELLEPEDVEKFGGPGEKSTDAPAGGGGGGGSGAPASPTPAAPAPTAGEASRPAALFEDVVAEEEGEEGSGVALEAGGGEDEDVKKKLAAGSKKARRAAVKGAAALAASVGRGWNCASCTFANAARAKTCAMCEMPR
jgi:hypothetical protein